MTKEKVVLCDIDGTVAIHEGRRDHFEWALVPNDLPNQPVVDLVQHLMKSQVKIIYVSAREASCRLNTHIWLTKHGIGIYSMQGSTFKTQFYNDNLLMRPTGDYRPDTIVKREIYERDIEPFYDV